MEAYTTSCLAADVMPDFARDTTSFPPNIPPMARIRRKDHIIASAIFRLSPMLITRIEAI